MSNKNQRGSARRLPKSAAQPPRSTKTPNRPSVSTGTTSIPIIDPTDTKTWAYINSQASDQDRVIAVKNPEGRYCHPACADAREILRPRSRPVPPTVHARIVNKVAASGGMICVLCNTFIVSPSNTRGKERAKAMWEKANESYLKGDITEAEWLAAAKRFASARTVDNED